MPDDSVRHRDEGPHISAPMRSGVACILVLALAGGFAAHVVGAATAASAQEAEAIGKTAWDGVYSAEQAARGQEQYFKECGSCHGEDLSGAGEAPGLVGEAFMQQWSDQSLEDLFTLLGTTMPPAGIKSSQARLDLIAFLLEANKFPAGQADLTRDQSDMEVLRKIRILRKVK